MPFPGIALLKIVLTSIINFCNLGSMEEISMNYPVVIRFRPLNFGESG